MNCQPEGILPSVTSIHTLNRNTNFRNKAIAFFRVCAFPNLSTRHLAQFFKTSCLLKGVNVSNP